MEQPETVCSVVKVAWVMVQKPVIWLHINTRL